MPFAPELRSHSQMVCTLYKTAMRLIESYYVARFVVRYHQVVLRSEFDRNRCECNAQEQRRLLWLGQHEVFSKKNPIPGAKCNGGACYKETQHPIRLLSLFNSTTKEKKYYQDDFKGKIFFSIPYSLGIAAGVAHGREVDPPDWVLDYWHPLEKAQYPEYFARRECRKKEYIDHWEKGTLR